MGGSETLVVKDVRTWNGDKTIPTITVNNAGGNQRMPDKDNFNCVIESSGCDEFETGGVNK